MSNLILLRGIAAAPGISIAPATVVDRQSIRIPKIRVATDGIELEKERLMDAVNLSRTQLKNAHQAIVDSGGGHGDHSLILQAHLLMLQDELLIDRALFCIEEKKINAEWALWQIMADTIKTLAALSNDYISERSQDVEFVGKRILRNLLGHDMACKANPIKPSIIVADDLSPAETAQMGTGPMLAIATEEGARTSHTAIIAKALGIPAVVGIKGLVENIGTDELLIVDGLEGTVIIRPDQETVERYQRKAKRYAAIESKMRSTRDQDSITNDGVEIELTANIELPSEAPFSLDYGAQGVGLYRTEFLYLDREHPPTEEDQFKTYQTVTKTIAPKPVIFRTFDLGADKMPGDLHSHERNPALGLRAIRMGLRNRQVLKTQLRALLRASKYGNLKIMFPLISGLSELRQAKAVLEETKAELTDVDCSNIKLGCMIELPSAVFVADLLAEEVDFFSIGTNDLIQYSIAIDRSNEHVAYLYTPYHPSILRAIKMVLDAGKKAGIEVSMCGNLASEMNMAPILVGMGLRSFSMSPVSIPFIKAAIRSVSAKEAEELCDRVLKMKTSLEIEDAAFQFMKDKINIDVNDV